MQQPETHREALLDTALRVLLRGGWIILPAILLTALAAYLYSDSKPRSYRASSSILFQTAADNVLGDANGSGGASFTDPSRQAATNEELLGLGVVSQLASQLLRGRLSSDEISSAVSIQSTRESDIVQIQATTTDPQRSALIANAYGEAFIAFRRDSARQQIQEAITNAEQSLSALSPAARAGAEGQVLRERVNQLQTARSLQTGGAELVQRASPPTVPVAPKPKRNGILGGIVGAILGFALAALRLRWDRGLKTTSELEQAFSRPVLAHVPRSRELARTDGFALSGQEAEAFRVLRTSLRYFEVDHELRTLLIASARPNEGKSTIARHLAATMAAMGDSVVLVDADLHRARASSATLVHRNRGLSRVLAGQDLSRALQNVRVDSLGEKRTLAVLPSGPVPPNPSELLESERMREVMTELQERFDMVIVDSPPLTLMSDALTLAGQASGVLAVGALGKTTAESVQAFTRAIELVGADFLGVVANFAPRGDRAEEAYYYHERA